jgi:exodeoxyribonuclease V beta subunit
MNKLDLFGARFAPGIHLIEASAGTGKTYAIAQLVLRFVVEQGFSVADDFLVVTFTKAATAELRQRIRQRLSLSAKLTRGDFNNGDEPLRDWLLGFQDQKQVRAVLETALYQLDLMPIQTIHSFCHHLLRGQALVAGELQKITLLEEEEAFYQKIIDDFWRREQARLSPSAWRRILAEVKTPDALYQRLKDWTAPLRFVPELTCLEDIKVSIEPKLWREFVSFMDELVEKKLFKQKARQWWEEFKQEEGLPERLGEVKLPQDLLGFLESQINAKKCQAKKLEALPGFAPYFQVLKTLAELSLAQRRYQTAWLQRAWRTFQEQSELKAREMGLMTHDLVLRRLANLVADPANARLLSAKLKTRVVLIDEFQDTDRHQWQIFSALFGEGRWLFLIGDPKQSIYGWRGADLSVYFKAKQAAGGLWQLTTNYRSHPKLVEAINLLFSAPDPGPFRDPKLKYYPLEAGVQESALALSTQDGRKWPPFTWCAFLDKGDPFAYRNRQEAQNQLAHHVAADIVRMLSEFSLVKDGVSRRLRPSDIAVLTRDNQTACLVRDVLREFKVPAVLIERRSVLSTDTAKKLYRLLQALWEKGDLRQIKRVLADGWFGFSAPALCELEQNGQISEVLEGFAEASELWWRESLLVAIEELFKRFEVWQHIAASKSGARTLADLRHLLEMLQEAAIRERLSPQALIAWYRRRLRSPHSADSQQLRLESDEDAVELVTMHSAKGLEYPIVLVLDLWRPVEAGRAKKEIELHTSDGLEVVFDLEPSRFEQAKEERYQEEQQEALRLAYVAMTRAKAHLRVYLLEKAGDSWSPLAHLLGTATQKPGLYQGAAALAQDHPQNFCLEEREWGEVGIVECGEWRGESLEEGGSAPLSTIHPPLATPPYPQASWILTSYSALVRGRPREPAEGWLARLLEEDLGEGTETESSLKGAAFGQLLHGLLERYPFAWLLKEELDLELPEAADRTEVSRLLKNALTTPLPEFALKDIPPSRQLKELEFVLPVKRLEASHLNRLFSGQPWFRPLDFPEVKGFLQGFIDLVVEHEGRFYLIDYKSNELLDYCDRALVEAMREHDYGLQAMLYALALHRHLKKRLPGYRFSSHFGGVRYLFLRGMDGKTPGRGVFGFCPQEAWIAQLEDWL